MNVLTDAEIRELGFDPTPRGWRPLSPEVDRALRAADERRTDRSLSFIHEPPFRIPGDAACIVCGEDAEASTVGTPTCSWICTALLSVQVLDELADALYTRADGSGGTRAVRPPPPPKPSLRPIPDGRPSVARALERIGSCEAVLERHGHRVRGRMAFCPLHENHRTPAMSLYERDGRSRAHCFGCDWSGDALDLEAGLSGEDLKATIARWS